MQIRKWLALLVSAALALSLLAGCGGKNQSLGQVILDLLDGQYANVTVEIDPELEADLRQAVHEGETDAEIRAALEKILGNGVSFRLIGDGQQGDSAWNLILYPGNDPAAAARSAFTEWNKVFGSLPRDGQYTAQIAMIETENGYAILVKATVDKAASRDDDDDDDEPEEPEDPGYTVDEKGDYTVNDSDGLQNLFFDSTGPDVEAAREKGFEGATITLAANTTYTVSQTFETPFKGTLQGESGATITLTGGSGLFKQISGGIVENITFDVQKTITGTTRAGAVADQNNGTIQNCDVTINGGSITANGTSDVYAGGLVGSNEKGGEITGCDVTINGNSITAANESGYVCAGGIAGENQGRISNCQVNGSYKGTDDNDSVDISVDSSDFHVFAGGIAGCNRHTGTVENCSVTKCKIEAGKSGNIVAAGGLVGLNESSSVPSTSVTGCYITATFSGLTVTVPNDDGSPTDSTDGLASVYAGTRIGFDERQQSPVG